jgi:ABC-type transporter Mla subunit MlaD
MVVVPLSKPANAEAAPKPAESCNLISMVAAASLAAGGALMASGKKRAGLVAAAAGTALAMVDQKETVRRLWNSLPGYLADLQDFLGRVESALDDVSSQRERLQKIFRR